MTYVHHTYAVTRTGSSSLEVTVEQLFDNKRLKLIFVLIVC